MSIKTDEYEKGTVLVIYRHKSNPSQGILAEYISSFEGDEDLSYHGSPWYEKFIKVKVLKTGEIRDFGNQDFYWRDVLGELKYLEDKIAQARSILL